MVLLPNFRLPTLIHTRTANSKWLYEISHHNPAWLHTEDAARIGIVTGDLIRMRPRPAGSWTRSGSPKGSDRGSSR